MLSNSQPRPRHPRLPKGPPVPATPVQPAAKPYVAPAAPRAALKKGRMAGSHDGLFVTEHHRGAKK